MIDTTEAFFARLAKRGNEPLFHNVSGTIRWDIEDTGNWFVAINNGSLTVSSETAGADCMVVGKQNPTTLFMQGRMRIQAILACHRYSSGSFPMRTWPA